MTAMSTFVLGGLSSIQDAIERVLSPRGRHLLVTLTLFTVFLVVTLGRVLFAIRLDVFAIDVRIYRAAAEAALTGGDPWSVTVDGLVFGGPPPTLLAYLPAALLPEAVAIALYGVVTFVAAFVTLRALRLPLWWLLFPPISDSLIVLNPDVIVIALLVAAPRIAALAVVLKVYSAVPLALTGRWQALLIGLALCLLSAPWWPMFFADLDAITLGLSVQSNGGSSAWGTWLMIPTLIALAVLFRRGAEWLAVPAVWPNTQLHYSALALPVAARNAAVALLLSFGVPLLAPLATIVYAAWVVTEPRLAAYRAGAARTDPSASL